MRFRKKPVEIEAHVVEKPYKQLAEWCGGQLITEDGRTVVGIAIQTLEGTMMANIGDWIIQGVSGEFYPCKPDIFVQTYEPVSTEGR